MTVSVAVVSQADIGDGERIVADVGFDASYPWRGEPLTADGFRFRAGIRLDSVEAAPVGRYLLEFVPDAALADRGKLKVKERIPPTQDFLFGGTPGLTIGSVSKKEVKIAGALAFMGNAGVPAELAAAEHAFTATTHDIAADAGKIQEAIYLLSSVDGAAVVVTKGTTADEDKAVPPAIPSNAAPAGLVKIQVEAGTTDFNATTDDLDAAHLAVTYEDANEQVYEAADLSALSVRVVALGR